MKKTLICLLLGAALLLAGACAKDNKSAYDGPAEVKVPVLLYHHMDDTGEGDATIKTETFYSHLDALQAAGYESVSLNELSAFARGEGALPEKCVLICFDDGYMSTYKLAYPRLRALGMNAAVFVIGVSVGKDTYKDTGMPMIPKFGWDEAREMTASGLIEIQSHTYDMHQAELYDGPGCRESARRLEGETEEEYEKAFLSDLERSVTEIERNTGGRVIALSYPHGLAEENTDALARSAGIELTFTTVPESNTVKRGDTLCLYSLSRYSIDDITAQELLALLETDGENG